MSGHQAHKNTISNLPTAESGTSASQNILGSPSQPLPGNGAPAPYSTKRSSCPLPQCKPTSLLEDGQPGELQQVSSLNGTGTKATPLPTSTLERGGNFTSNKDGKLIASPASIAGTAEEMSATPVRKFLAPSTATGASVADLRHEAHAGGLTERSNESRLSKSGENVPKVNKDDARAMKEAVSVPGDFSSVVTMRKKDRPNSPCLSHSKEVIILDSDDDNGADEEESFERKHQGPPANAMVVAPSFSDAGTDSNDSARDTPRPCPDVTVNDMNSHDCVSNCTDNKSHKKMIDAKTSIATANDIPMAAPLPPPANSNSSRNNGMSMPDGSSLIRPICENENPMKAMDATKASAKTSTLESMNDDTHPSVTAGDDDKTAGSISGKGKGTVGETNTLEPTTAETGSKIAIEGGSNGTDDAGQSPCKNPMTSAATSPSANKKINSPGSALSPSNATETDGESYMMTPPVLPQRTFEKSNMSKPLPVDTGSNHRGITSADSAWRERPGFAQSPPRTRPQVTAPYPHAKTSTKRSYRSNVGVTCFNGSPTAQRVPPMQTMHQRRPPPHASYWPPCAQRPYTWNRPPQQYQQVPRYSVPGQPPPNAGVGPVGPYNISPFQNGNRVQGGPLQPRIVPNTHTQTEISRRAVHQSARQVLPAGGGFGAPAGVGFTSYPTYQQTQIQHPQLPNGHGLPTANNKYGPSHSPGVSPNTASSWFHSQQKQALEAYQKKQKEAEQERERARQASLPVIAIPIPDDDSGEVSVTEAEVGVASDECPQPNSVHNQPLIGVAISSYTLDEIARMPVSFAYDVSDGGASEVAARKAAAEFESAKKKAMMSTIRKRKPDREVAGKAKGVDAREKTAKKPRNPAKEIWSGVPDEELPPSGWPPGWTKKIFQRASGATAGGKDRYWYSPGQKKFRSLVEVKRFLEALASVDGQDEEMAWKLFKNR